MYMPKAAQAGMVLGMDQERKSSEQPHLIIRFIRYA
jgi:hypothetical protein